MIGLSIPSTPSHSEILFSYCSFLCILAFEYTETPSQSQISFVNVISCSLAFQYQNTLPKWNIFCYCSFLYIFPFRDQCTLPKWNIFCYCNFFVYLHLKTSTSSQSEFFCLYVCIGISVPTLKDQHTEQSTITTLRKYFTLGGSFGTDRPIYTINCNNEKYFTLGGSAGVEIEIYRSNYNNQEIFPFGREHWSMLKCKYTEETTITKNISLWEGALV